MSNEKQTPKKEDQKQIAHSERFRNLALRQLEALGQNSVVPELVKKTVQNYFIKLDQTLRLSEIKRMAKDEKYREPLAYKWENVNLEQLALDAIKFAQMGLDPLLPNHINLIPYKNKNTGKYDITFIDGYVGCELNARKYGFDCPDNITIELVYSSDIFKMFKKDVKANIDSYEFTITDPFNRGVLIGGFFYKEYFNTPEKNKLTVWNLEEIMKRKPEYASAEFWGGETEVWAKDESGKNVKQMIQKDGWFKEMCEKTIKRAAWKTIPIDPHKVDEKLLEMMGILNTQEQHTEEQVPFVVPSDGNENNPSPNVIDISSVQTQEPQKMQQNIAESNPPVTPTFDFSNQPEKTTVAQTPNQPEKTKSKPF